MFLREGRAQEEHGENHSHCNAASILLKFLHGFRIYDAAVQPSLLGRPGATPSELDPPLEIPKNLPAVLPPNKQERFSQTPIYDVLT